jgi:hypothetical protein
METGCTDPMHRPGIEHPPIERVRVLYALIIEELDAELTVGRRHSSTLSCGDTRRQQGGAKLKTLGRSPAAGRLTPSRTPA